MGPPHRDRARGGARDRVAPVAGGAHHSSHTNHSSGSGSSANSNNNSSPKVLDGYSTPKYISRYHNCESVYKESEKHLHN